MKNNLWVNQAPTTIAEELRPAPRQPECRDADCHANSRILHVSCFESADPRSQIAGLRAAVGEDGLIIGQSQLQTYECDGLTNFRVMPAAVVLPRYRRAGAGSGPRVCHANRIPFVARGAGHGPERRCAARWPAASLSAWRA